MPALMTSPVRVRVPATSANLGPAFDAAGLALSLYDEVEVQVSVGGLEVDVTGEGALDLPRDENHLVVAAMRAAFARLGGQPAGLLVRCTNRIPQARGLGSSSGAIVAGILAARALVDGGSVLLDDRATLQLATELEGHPDNVAACLLGGFTLAWSDPGPGAVQAIRRAPHPDLLPVAFVPTTQASTKQVRGLLPPTVPHGDAAANAGRAALLALALTDDLDLLLAATVDRLHQQYRAAAMPATAELVAVLRGGGIAGVVSGAGPTVLALVRREHVAEALAHAPARWTALALPVDPAGATVS